MKTKNIFKLFAAAAATIAVLAGCTKHFEEISKNQFGVSDE